MTSITKMENDAWFTWQWAVCKRLQVDIAVDLGYHSSSQICTSIARFIKQWHLRGEQAVIDTNGLGKRRMLMAEEALARYIAAGEILIEPCESSYEIFKYDTAYSKAVDEHAFLLRCEGLTYKQISIRLGVSKNRCRQRVSKFSRSLKKAMKYTKVYFLK